MLHLSYQHNSIEPKSNIHVRRPVQRREKNRRLKRQSLGNQVVYTLLRLVSGPAYSLDRQHHTMPVKIYTLVISFCSQAIRGRNSRPESCAPAALGGPSIGAAVVGPQPNFYRHPEPCPWKGPCKEVGLVHLWYTPSMYFVDSLKYVCSSTGVEVASIHVGYLRCATRIGPMHRAMFAVTFSSLPHRGQYHTEKKMITIAVHESIGVALLYIGSYWSV